MPDTKKQIIMYTDGACLGNPGPGGYGVVILNYGRRIELSGGYRQTTNNRMELLAAIKGLKKIKPGDDVKIFSDSYYLISGIKGGRARRWKAKGWMRNKKDKALNADLWEILLDLCQARNVDFEWVRGHAGVAENERCDFLSSCAAKMNNLPADSEYEKEKKKPRRPRQGKLF